MKNRAKQFVLLTFLSLIPAAVFAAPPAPILDAVQNYSGPLIAFWDTTAGAVAGDTDYYLFISTSPLPSANPATLYTDPSVSKKITAYAGARAMRYTFNKAVDEETYYMAVAGRDGTGWSGLSNTRAATSQVERLFIQNITSTVDGVSGYVLDNDSSTITFTITLRGELGSPFLPSARVRLDIKTGVNPASVFATVPELPVTVVVSSSNFSATATYTWDGRVYSDEGHKHNGGYNLTATPIDNNDVIITAGLSTYGITVDVVHVNVGKGLVYQILGSEQPHYGPPFYFDYYLSKNSFVTWKIWDRHQTDDASDDTLVKIVVSTVPRVTGDLNSSPEGRDKMVSVESWDGRNDQGLIVSNDIYRFTFDAVEFRADPSLVDHSITREGTIAFDVLRLVDISATGITDQNALAHIKYTLAGANSMMGGAMVKIVICAPGTSFFMAASSGTMTYASGTGTYAYLPGDPVPTDASYLKKVFIFARTAGSLDETWNGFDESGSALPNNNYVFAISATDDSGNHAIDNSGNDRVIIGNITIDRTSAQSASDATPPTVTSISAGGSAIPFTGGTVLTAPFSSLAVSMNDAGSGVDLNNSLVTLAGPTTGYIAVTATNDNNGTITLSFAQQTTNGTYTVRIRPRDKVGNTASDIVTTFTLSVTEAGVAAAFDESVYAYPNPAKGVNSVSFAYDVKTAPATMKLEVFNMLGEPVFDVKWTAAVTGPQTTVWDLTNNAQNKLATGLYLYRISTDSVSKKPKFKKLIIVQ